MIAAILPCLVFLSGVLAGMVLTWRDNDRKRKEIQILREDVKAWKHAAVYWQRRAGFRITPETRIIRQRPLTERLNMVNEEEAAAARMAWGDQVQAEEFLAEIDQEWEGDPR